MAGIYLHIPFCKQACYYCDFHFSTNQELRPQFVAALVREIELQRDYLENDTVRTIYFGGGTPSLLTPAELERILDALRANFRVLPDAEITLEANPDDLSKARLGQLRGAGVNRLSIGIQSFQADTLRFFNRAHSAAEAQDCVERARHAGFSNLSIDLIYGIPGKQTSDWRGDIQKALALAPEHLSAYALTIEEKTVFGRWHKKQQLHPAAEDLVAEQFEFLMDELERRGYTHYEISNFCKPGFLSQHNTAYWQGVSYLGLGPSAHSFRGETRQYNVANNALYIKSLAQDKVPFTPEVLAPHERVNEWIYTGLRTQWGVDCAKIKSSLGFDVQRQRSALLERFSQGGWVMVNNEAITLTRKGKLVADQIARDLFTDEVELGALRKTL